MQEMQSLLTLSVVQATLFLGSIYLVVHSLNELCPGAYVKPNIEFLQTIYAILILSVLLWNGALLIMKSWNIGWTSISASQSIPGTNTTLQLPLIAPFFQRQKYKSPIKSFLQSIWHCQHHFSYSPTILL
jgi:hypothetical protein